MRLTMATLYRDTFPHRHVILPVIHVASEDQALRNAEVAWDAGCDGIFLINHGMGHRELLAIQAAVAARAPGRWIGVNCLDLDPDEAFSVLDGRVHGLWVDNAMVDERSSDQPKAEAIARARQASGWGGLYFGGVAFKYQRQVGDLAAAARKAIPYMDVVTTSGPGTGQAADYQKIASLKAALGSFPLAIASGITPENVNSYLPVADCFLVATGISRNFHELDSKLVRPLVEAVRGYTPSVGV
jgi:predicted TIM-barrel enzyme